MGPTRCYNPLAKLLSGGPVISPDSPSLGGGWTPFTPWQWETRGFARRITASLLKRENPETAYMDAMPLYRQEQMWKRMGVALKRGAMANWVIQVADLDLRSFWKRIRSELLTQSAIHAGDTVMQVHKEQGRPDTAKSRMWVYASAKRGDIQLRCFEYRESRSGKWAKAFLEGFKGVLITDGYSGCDQVQQAKHVGTPGRTCAGNGRKRCPKAPAKKAARLRRGMSCATGCLSWNASLKR